MNLGGLEYIFVSIFVDGLFCFKLKLCVLYRLLRIFSCGLHASLPWQFYLNSIMYRFFLFKTKYTKSILSKEFRKWTSTLPTQTDRQKHISLVLGTDKILRNRKCRLPSATPTYKNNHSPIASVSACVTQSASLNASV